MVAWGGLAAGIVAYEWLLARTKRPLLSHEVWAALDAGRSPYVTGVTTVVVAHLRFRRRWPHAIAFGAAVAIAEYLLPEHRRARE